MSASHFFKMRQPEGSTIESSFPRFTYTGAQMAQVELQLEQAYNLPRNVSPHPLLPLPHLYEVSSYISPDSSAHIWAMTFRSPWLRAMAQMDLIWRTTHLHLRTFKWLTTVNHSVPLTFTDPTITICTTIPPRHQL